MQELLYGGLERSLSTKILQKCSKTHTGAYKGVIQPAEGTAAIDKLRPARWARAARCIDPVHWTGRKDIESDATRTERQGGYTHL